MPLKKSAGNMYPWVTHTHSHLAGRCSHECLYCYVQAAERRHKTGRYVGPVYLRRDELAVPYGEGRTIFVEHMNDLFAADVPADYIELILHHVRAFPKNIYVFQSKNPARFAEFGRLLPDDCILGTTIESNREYAGLSKAPSCRDRARAMMKIPARYKRFVTIEPVLDFDVAVLAAWIGIIRPDFLNLGADSKGFGLDEPTVDKIMALTEELRNVGVELREKHNLQRLRIKE